MFGRARIDLTEVHEALSGHTDDIQRVRKALEKVNAVITELTANHATLLSRIEVLETCVRSFLLNRVDYLALENDRLSDRVGTLESETRKVGLVVKREPRQFNIEDRQ